MNKSQHHHPHETSAEAIYTCPMHPEVRQEGPGKCPKCGMFLVPEGEAGGHGHAAHGHGKHDHAQ